MGVKIIAKNKKAYFNYFIEEKFEAGIQLVGTEIKSLRLGKVSMTEAYINVDEHGEVWVLNMKIPQYEFGNINNHKEDRKRKLLLNNKEIKHITHQLSAQRVSIVPTAIYFKESLVKLEIGLGKGKKLYDKREVEAKKDAERKLQRKIYD